MDVLQDVAFLETLLKTLPHWLINSIVIGGCLYKFCGNFTKTIMRIIMKADARKERSDRIQNEEIQKNRDDIRETKEDVKENKDDIAEIKQILISNQSIFQKLQDNDNKLNEKVDEIYDFLTKK
jgi:hypothetical protein